MSDATVPFDLIDHDHPDHMTYPMLSRQRICSVCRSSGDLREALAAELWEQRRAYDASGLFGPYRQDYAAADVALAVVRAHDAAHPEPWAVDLAQCLFV